MKGKKVSFSGTSLNTIAHSVAVGVGVADIAGVGVEKIVGEGDAVEEIAGVGEGVEVMVGVSVIVGVEVCVGVRTVKYSHGTLLLRVIVY